jgi:hypothetical protein
MTHTGIIESIISIKATSSYVPVLTKTRNRLSVLCSWNEFYDHVLVKRQEIGPGLDPAGAVRLRVIHRRRKEG